MADDNKPRPRVQLWTDGACLGNPGPGGWGYILRHVKTGKQRKDSGGENQTTNNRMEITDVIRGLSALHTACEVDLCSDSQYVLKAIKEWMPAWKKNNWIKKDKRPVANVDLWKQLDDLLQKHTVTTSWTKGHAGHPENEECDELASVQARQHSD